MLLEPVFVELYLCTLMATQAHFGVSVLKVGNSPFVFRILSPALGVLFSVVCAGVWLLTFGTAEGASLTWWCGILRAIITRSVEKAVCEFISDCVRVHVLGIFFMAVGRIEFRSWSLGWRWGFLETPKELGCKETGSPMLHHGGDSPLVPTSCF